MQIKIHLVRRDPLPNGAIPNSNELNRSASPQYSSPESSQVPNGSIGSRPYTPNLSPNVLDGLSSSLLERMNITRYRGNMQRSPTSTRPQQPHNGLDSRLIAYIPQADHQSFKTAFYTVSLLLFACLMCAGGWCTYNLMFVFLKPMMWAVLTGTVLFPVKMVVTDTTKGWLRSLRESSTPLVVGVVMLPVSWLNFMADGLWHIVTTPALLGAVVGAFALIKLMIYDSLFLSVIGFFASIYSMIDSVLQLLAHPVIPFAIIYACVYLGWVYVTQTQRPNKKLARVLSLPIWLIVIVNVCEFTGPLRVVVFAVWTITLILLAAGAIHYENALVRPAQSDVPPAEPSTSMGDLLLRGMFGCCALLFVARHTWVLVFLTIPLAFAICKQIWIKCDVGEKLRSWFYGNPTGAERKSSESRSETAAPIASRTSTVDSSSDTSVSPAIKPKADIRTLSIRDRLKRLYDILVPHTLRDFAKFVFSKDQNIVMALEESMDLMSSVVVILGLCIGMLFATFLVIFQTHNEAVHLARLGGNVMTELKTGTWAAAMNFTDSQMSEHDIDEYIDQAFTQGRAWIGQQVRLLADGSDPERADMLEAQVMQIIDNLYQLWEQQDSPTVGGVQKEKDIWSHLSQATDLRALQNEIKLIIQENVDTVLAVAQSIWSVLSSNIGFVTQVISVVAGLLLSFGMELLNYIIELVVYFTMLYYLLVFSGDQFKPIEVLSRFTIKSEADQINTSSPEDSVTAAIEQAINGVFLLSAKMSIFYGMYTWFIHNLFGLNIVFLPSILALVLAAIPLTAPSWVCFIGMAELFVRGEATAALLFFGASVAPMMFADNAFYAEVKGTHPYLTGLAIVGGMYWLGLQGAIIGPILLCCVLALVQVYTNVLS